MRQRRAWPRDDRPGHAGPGGTARLLRAVRVPLEPALALADRVAAFTGPPLRHVFFTLGGSDAVDTAIKIVRAFWARSAEPARTKILSRDWAYHGVALGGTSVSGLAHLRSDFEPLLGQTARIPHNHCLHCPFGLAPDACALQCAEQFEVRIRGSLAP